MIIYELVLLKLYMIICYTTTLQADVFSQKKPALNCPHVNVEKISTLCNFFTMVAEDYIEIRLTESFVKMSTDNSTLTSVTQNYVCDVIRSFLALYTSNLAT